MTNQQPDKFFREKLRNYEQTVPPGAWERVARAQRKQGTTRLLFRAAAAVLLLATGTLLIYPKIRPEQKPIARQAPAPPQKSIPPAIVETDSTVANPEAAPAPPPKPGREVPPQRRRSQTPEHPPGAIRAQPEPIAAIPVDSSSLPVPEDVVPAGPEKRMTIVFTVEEVNSRYLKKSGARDATPEAESSSGVQKLLDQAYDLTSNQDVMGSLRQKKNELFALNFRSEKKTTPNK